jgi:outer membrane receptor protein involved in Fe transport
VSKFEATAQSVLSGTDGGGFNHKDNLMVNIPLIDDTLALRVTGSEDYTSGWIKRIVVNPFPLAGGNPVGTLRGDVEGAPIQAQYPGSNSYQIYALHATLLWKPSDDLSVTPSFFHETSSQAGISAYDSDPGTLAHYQPFDIAEPSTDSLTAYSLNINYHFAAFDLTSSTSRWTRNSIQVEEASEAFNNPAEFITYASNYGLANPGYYGPTGSGPERGVEDDPSHQFTEELRLTSTGTGRSSWVAGLYYSDFYSLWTFAGTTPNYGSYMDLGTLAPATTPNWFDAYSPTNLKQYAAFGDFTYALTDEFKVDAGARVNHYDYRFSSCISGWGSGFGAAQPSCSGLIPLSSTSFNPKLNLTYTFSPDLMAYTTVSTGFRPGGGDAVYPTTGAAWGPAYLGQNYEAGGKFPTKYSPDHVISYELGEKSRFFDRRLTLNASVYYEDWRDIQLEAYPNDWALNINGNYAHIYGIDVDAVADLGAGFQIELAAGYLYEYLDGGPHWVIQPIHKLPEVSPESGTLSLNYSKALAGSYTFTARLESAYTGPRYSIFFFDPYEFVGNYRQVPGYDLVNVRAGLKHDGWSATLFVNNLTNKHAQLESMFTENEPQPSFTRIETNQPLTGGVDLTYRF